MLDVDMGWHHIGFGVDFGLFVWVHLLLRVAVIFIVRRVVECHTCSPAKRFCWRA